MATHPRTKCPRPLTSISCLEKTAKTCPLILRRDINELVNTSSNNTTSLAPDRRPNLCYSYGLISRGHESCSFLTRNLYSKFLRFFIPLRPYTPQFRHHLASAVTSSTCSSTPLPSSGTCTTNSKDHVLPAGKAVEIDVSRGYIYYSSSYHIESRYLLPTYKHKKIKASTSSQG